MAFKMTRDELPDLFTCLEFCLSVQKNLLYFYEQESQEANEIDIERRVNALKSTIEHNFSESAVVCRVTKQILPIEPGNSDQLEIHIIPKIDSLDRDQQNLLVKNMNGNPHRIYIGMIAWKSISHNNVARDLDTRDTLSSSVKLRDWLKHRFWLSFSERPEPIPPSPMQSKSQVENYLSIDGHVTCKPAIRRYILDIMVHLRMHRMLDITKGGGVHTGSLEDVVQLAKLLSYKKYNKNFVIPEHVKLACQWYFPSHLELVRDSSMDVSVLYGSKPEMVDGFLDKIAQLKLAQSSMAHNPLFLEALIVRDVLKRVVPPA